MDFASAAAIGGAVVAPLAGYFGQQEANRANAQMQDSANQWNAKEAQANREWQAKMSNTAHQREVKDLIAAGLNPILAANGGASTPSGGAASASASKDENPIPSSMLNQALSSAVDAKRLGMEMETQKELIKKVQAETAESKMRSTVMSKDIPKAEMINEAYKAGKKILNNIMSPTQWSPKNNPNLRNYIEGSKIQLRSN